MTKADQVIERAFYGLCATLATVMVGFLGYMAINIGELNKSMAVIATRVDNHESRIHDIEKFEARIMKPKPQ